MHDAFSPQMVEVWALLGSILGSLLAILLIVAATLWASTQVTQQARGLWAAIRGHHAQIVAQVDDPTDAINAQLAQITPIPAGVWAAVLPAFLNAFSDALSTAFLEGADTPESNKPSV